MNRIFSCWSVFANKFRFTAVKLRFYFRICLQVDLNQLLNRNANDCIVSWQSIRLQQNNLYKSTSGKTRQIEWESGLARPKKSFRFPVWPFRVCKRATLGGSKGHSCTSTVALLQTRRARFRPVFGHYEMSVKFKLLIVSALKVPPNLLICNRRPVRWQMSKTQGLNPDK